MTESLPLELLARILCSTAAAKTRHLLAWTGLRTLMRCTATSRRLRAAAELAVETRELYLSDDTPPPAAQLSSTGIHGWIRRCTGLRLQLSDGELSTTPAFRSLVKQCDGHPAIKATLHGRSGSLRAAQCELALAASAAVQDFHCCGHVPVHLGPQLRSLTVSDPETLAQQALEFLVVRLQNCEQLVSLTLDLACSTSPELLLGASELGTVQLPQLRQLTLSVNLALLGDIDVSWLELPRAFTLCLVLHNSDAISSYNHGDGDDGTQLRLANLEELSAVLQPTDQLKLVAAKLTDRTQQVLGGLQLASFSLWVCAQDVLYLPQAPQLTICFEYDVYSDVHDDVPPASLSWAAITRSAGHVAVVLEAHMPALEILGCATDSAAPAFDGAGWQLAVYSQGIRPKGLFMHDRDGVFVLSNRAAAHWELQ